MIWKRVIVSWMTLLALVFASAVASARADVSSKTHVGAIDLAAAICIEASGLASAEERQGNRSLSTTETSDVPHAARGVAKLPWGFWKDLPKVVEGGRTYAQIGQRIYTEHAVQRMLPAAMGGRGVAPAFVEAAIQTGAQTTQVVGGVTRTVFTSGNVQVVTEQAGRLVVTVMRVGGP